MDYAEQFDSRITDAVEDHVRRFRNYELACPRDPAAAPEPGERRQLLDPQFYQFDNTYSRF
jgi:hypothetical protein